MDKIDLDANFYRNCPSYKYTGDITKEEVINAMKEAISQALVLASEQAKIHTSYVVRYVSDDVAEETRECSINKQSILDVEKLIK